MAVQAVLELLEVQVPAAQMMLVAGVVIQQYIIYFHLLEMVMTQQVEWEVVVDGLPMIHLLALSSLVAVSMVAVAVEKVKRVVAPLYMGLVVVVELHIHLLLDQKITMVEKVARGDNMLMVEVAHLMILLLVRL